MAQMKAWVDHRGRPVIQVERPGSDEPFLALIDTGCSCELFLDEEAAVELGVVAIAKLRRNQDAETVRLGDGSMVVVKLGRLLVVWDGIETPITVRISTGPLFVDDGSWPGTEPKALLGCQLLAGKTLNINFCNGRIDIGSCLVPPS